MVLPTGSTSDAAPCKASAVFGGGTCTVTTDVLEVVVAFADWGIGKGGAVSTSALGTAGCAVFATTLVAGVVGLTSVGEIAAGPSFRAEAGLTGDVEPSLATAAGRGTLAPAMG